MGSWFWEESSATLISQEFGDVYFSKDGGEAESRYVFWEGNQVAKRWLSSDPLAIGELGFGTGLNAFVTLREWYLTSTRASVHFTSLEKYPLEPKALYLFRESLPGLPTWTDDMFDSYEKSRTKYLTGELNHWSYSFPKPEIDSRFQIDVYFGGVEKTLPKFPLIDVWYLDGFAPKKNPQMWESSVLAEIRKKTKPNGSFATFSSAGFLKRGFTELGFVVKKQKGFGKKREMLIGKLG